MRFLWLCPAALLMVLLAANASASDCRAPVYYGTPYVAPKAVEKAVVTDTIAVFPTIVQIVNVPLPLFATVYAPPALPAVPAAPVPTAPLSAAAPASAAPAAPAPAQDAVLAALARLEERLDRLERGAAVPPPPAAPLQPPPAAPLPVAPADPFAPQAPAVPMPSAEPQARADPMTGLFTARCAACHDRRVADRKGGGLTLTEGGRPTVLTPATRLKVWQQAHAGKMPRGGPRLAAAELGVLDRWLASP